MPAEYPENNGVISRRQQGFVKNKSYQINSIAFFDRLESGNTVDTVSLEVKFSKAKHLTKFPMVPCVRVG